jgi:DUF1009 family protein
MEPPRGGRARLDGTRAQPAAAAEKPRRTIGVLAGGGRLPVEVIEAIRARGDDVHVLALDGEADSVLRYPHTVVRWGSIGRILSTMRDKTDGELVFVGRVRRPDLLRLGPDLGFFTNLPALLKMMSGGDDAILTRVVRFFETKGVRVRGVHEVAPELVADVGPVGSLLISDDAHDDLDLGRAVLAALAPHDVGQAVVVAGGEIVGIEAAEGTDRMLERVAQLRGDAMREGVLVKALKQGQELRIDMPAIGPATIERAAAANLAGVAISAGALLIAERASVEALADSAGLFVHGYEPEPIDLQSESAGSTLHTVPMAGRKLRLQDHQDIAKAQAVMSALARFRTGDAIVVSGRYVLAVAAQEGVFEMLRRVPLLRQWGAARTRRPRGVLAVRSQGIGDAEAQMALQAAAWQAGIAGIVIDHRDRGRDGVSMVNPSRSCPKDRFVARLELSPDAEVAR